MSLSILVPLAWLVVQDEESGTRSTTFIAMHSAMRTLIPSNSFSFVSVPTVTTRIFDHLNIKHIYMCQLHWCQCQNKSQHVTTTKITVGCSLVRKTTLCRPDCFEFQRILQTAGRNQGATRRAASQSRSGARNQLQQRKIAGIYREDPRCAYRLAFF